MLCVCVRVCFVLECIKPLDASKPPPPPLTSLLCRGHQGMSQWTAATVPRLLQINSETGRMNWRRDINSAIRSVRNVFPQSSFSNHLCFFLPHSFGVSLSKIFFLWKSRIILIRVMMIMPSLIKVMEVIMTGIITQLAMEAIISIAV